MEKMLARMRANGWVVAVHNDYQMDGEFYTFWLFTHPSGFWVRGEAKTDEQAIADAQREAIELARIPQEFVAPPWKDDVS
jgi:hypothetical protein